MGKCGCVRRLIVVGTGVASIGLGFRGKGQAGFSWASRKETRGLWGPWGFDDDEGGCSGDSEGHVSLTTGHLCHACGASTDWLKW